MNIRTLDGAENSRTFIRSHADEWRRRHPSIRGDLASAAAAAASRSDSNIVRYDKFNQVALKQEI